MWKAQLTELVVGTFVWRRKLAPNNDTKVIGRSDSAMAITVAQLGAKLIEEAGSSSTGGVLEMILEVWFHMLFIWVPMQRLLSCQAS
jgi:hypothetical protein